MPSIALGVLLLALAVPILRAPMSGDYGQWLMVSRSYSGESVPVYRDAWAVAPVVPASLASIRALVGDPILALNVVRLLLLALVTWGFYRAGGSLFRVRSAGLLTAVFAFALTDRYLELFAFGGLLQLASLGFMLMGVASLGHAAGSSTNERTWWTVGAGCMGLAVLSHAGSVVVVVPVGLLSGLVVVAKTWRRRGLRQWLGLLAPAAILPATALVYWLFVLVPANQGYTENPAALGFRGPGRLFASFTANEFTPWLVGLGAACIAQGLARELFSRRPQGYSIVAAWALASWGTLALAIAADVPTDYPRFAGPLLAPLVVGAAGGATDALRWVNSTLVPAATEQGRTNVVLALAGLVVFVGGRGEVDAFRIHANSYGVADLGSIQEMADWMTSSLPEDRAIVALEPRTAKWIEGLTGRAALFANKTRYSFRSYEWDRSVAADALVRSTTALVNGLVGAKFMDFADGEASVPRELLLSFNHDGEWADLLRLPEGRTKIVAAGGPAAVFTLAALEPVSVERIENDDSIVVRTSWTGSSEGRPVRWTRTVSLVVGNPVVDVVDEIAAEFPLEAAVFELAPFDGALLPTWQTVPGTAVATFPQLGKHAPVVDVRVAEGDATFEISADRHGLLISVDNPTRIHMQFEARTASAPISKLALLYPPDVLADYRIGAALLRKDGAFEPRLRRLTALGLVPVLEAGDYVLLALPDHVSARGRLAPPAAGGFPEEYARVSFGRTGYSLPGAHGEKGTLLAVMLADGHVGGRSERSRRASPNMLTQKTTMARVIVGAQDRAKQRQAARPL